MAVACQNPETIFREEAHQYGIPIDASTDSVALAGT